MQSMFGRMRDTASTQRAEAEAKKLLKQRHEGRDFYISNNATLRQTVENTNGTMTLLITSIALISLLVGGIGVMNIMLVSGPRRSACAWPWVRGKATSCSSS